MDDQGGTSASAADLRADHPELYGALLAVNERIDRSGAGIGWFLTTLWVLCVVAIIGEWIPEIGSLKVRHMKSVWIYALLAFLFFVTGLRLQARTKRAAYRRGRDTIEREMATAGLTPNLLIALLEGNDDLELVTDEIKADEDFDTRRR